MPPEEADLKQPEKAPIQLEDAYRIGHTLSFVTTATGQPSNYPLGGGPEADDYIIDALEMAKTTLDKAVRNYSAHISIDRTIDSRRSSYELDGDTELEYLSEEDARMLNERSEEWSETILHELSQRTNISVESTGLFDVKKAMESPESLFNNTVLWEALPEDVRSDIN
jgi:hypothetical protein